MCSTNLLPTISYSQLNINFLLSLKLLVVLYTCCLFSAVLQGVVDSLLLFIPAHSNMKSASLLTSMGSLTNASINRSPYAYEQNPDKDRCVCACAHVQVCVPNTKQSKSGTCIC